MVIVDRGSPIGNNAASVPIAKALYIVALALYAWGR